MGRTPNRLSSAKVKSAKKGMHCDGGGLYLQCTAGAGKSKRKSWLFRYALNGRERQMGLGSVGTVSLAEAREKADACRRLRAQDVDPIQHRDAEAAKARLEAAKAVSFDQCAEAYIKAHREGWRNTKHTAQWVATLGTYASPKFGQLPVAAIDMGFVLKALEPIWTTKPETASRLRGRIERILDWAKTRGYRQGENPARWKGCLDTQLAPRSKVRRVEHYAALAYREIGTFIAELRGREGVAARALEFAILTAARTGEVLDARWDEIDLTLRIWTVPATRMKGNRQHRVPLSDAAISVLSQMAKVKRNDHVFPGDLRPGLSNMALLMLLRRMGRGDLTAHGFRSTFRDWAAECTNFAGEVAEAALAHIVGDKVEAAYRRGDLFEKRRRLMDAWSEFCGNPLVASQIIPLRRDASAS